MEWSVSFFKKLIALRILTIAQTQMARSQMLIQEHGKAEKYPCRL
jgi:hypothetical protein